MGVDLVGEVRQAPRRVQDGRLRRGLGVVQAVVVAAEAAVVAGRDLHAVGVGVGPRSRGGRVREGMVALLPRRLGEHRVVQRVLQRRHGKGIRARPLEGIAAFHDLAAQVPRGAGGAADLVEMVHEGLHFLPGEGEVLDLQVLLQLAGLVGLVDEGLELQVRGRRTDQHAGPVNAGAADAVAGLEGAPGAGRQRDLVGVVPHRRRHLARAGEDLLADGIGELVGRLGVEVAGIGPLGTAFEGADLETGAGQLDAHDRTGPAQSDNHRIDGVLDDSHGKNPSGRGASPEVGGDQARSPMMLTGPSG